MVDLKKLISQMTIDEKIGQIVQYDAGFFINSKAAPTGAMQNLELVHEDLFRIGSFLNLADAKEMYELQDTHLEGDRNKSRSPASEQTGKFPE